MLNFLGLDPVSGFRKLFTAITTSGGVADAGKLVGTNAAGVIDDTFLPGGDSRMIEAFEALSAGDLVNVFDNAGTPAVRRADAMDAAKPANGFVKQGVAAAAQAKVFFRGSATGVAGVVVGVDYFLSATTPGGVTSDAAALQGTANLKLVQYVGRGLDAGVLGFVEEDITLI